MAEEIQGIPGELVNENPQFLLYNPDTHQLIEHQKLQQLADLITEYKGDIIALVSVFKQFEGLFSGKASIMSIMPVITKLINNKESMNELAAVLPIIEKYSTPQNNG